jgi:hypothetical protein
MFNSATSLLLLGLGLAPLSSLALIHGVDSSALVPEATYHKAKGEGFTKAVIRGYEEACGVGGEVDPNFVGSYNNARAAGITNIDTYWFPCTGSTHRCKSFSTQIAELGAVFKSHKMDIGTIWIDFEYDSVCNNVRPSKFYLFVYLFINYILYQWDYGTGRNLVVAREIIAAIKASGYKFGIYSSPGEWSRIFGSYGVNLDSSAPLWFATYDNVQNLDLTTPFGG